MDHNEVPVGLEYSFGKWSVDKSGISVICKGKITRHKICTASEIFMYSREREANAKLIALAPFLYEEYFRLREIEDKYKAIVEED